MLLLIDGSTIFFRSFHGIPATMRTSKGELVNAVFGFTNSIMALVEEFQPTHIACAFDLAAKTFRHDAFAEYKANRAEAPEGMFEQLPRIHAMLAAMGITSIALPGYEADDVIGTLSAMAETQHLPSLIVSGDNDFIQLVSPLTSFFTIARGMRLATTITPELVLANHGLTPSQWIDYKALRGDPSDNLPGVPGIGEKTAKELLKSWQSLDNLYNHLSEVKPTLQTKLREHEKDARFTKEMVTIHRTSPITEQIRDIACVGYNNPQMYELCSELEFHKLAQRFTGPATLF